MPTALGVLRWQHVWGDPMAPAQGGTSIGTAAGLHLVRKRTGVCITIAPRCFLLWLDLLPLLLLQLRTLLPLLLLVLLPQVLLLPMVLLLQV